MKVATEGQTLASEAVTSQDSSAIWSGKLTDQDGSLIPKVKILNSIKKVPILI